MENDGVKGKVVPLFDLKKYKWNIIEKKKINPTSSISLFNPPNLGCT